MGWLDTLRSVNGWWMMEYVQGVMVIASLNCSLERMVGSHHGFHIAQHSIAWRYLVPAWPDGSYYFGSLNGLVSNLVVLRFLSASNISGGIVFPIDEKYVLLIHFHYNGTLSCSILRYLIDIQVQDWICLYINLDTTCAVIHSKHHTIRNLH